MFKIVYSNGYEDGFESLEHMPLERALKYGMKVSPDEFELMVDGDYNTLPFTGYDVKSAATAAGMTAKYDVAGVIATREGEVCICFKRVHFPVGMPNYNHINRQIEEGWRLLPMEFDDAMNEIWRRQNTNLAYMTIQRFVSQFSKPGMLAAHGNRYLAIGNKSGKVFAGTVAEFVKSRSRYIADVRETARVEKIYPENAVELTTDATKPIVIWVK